MTVSHAAEPVVLVDYDPRWPTLFAEQRARVVPAVAPFAVTIEHIGSTAVPGLCAKPIIDILVTVERFGPPDLYIPALAPLGYVFHPHAENTARHAFGVRDALGQRPIPGHNLHICQHDGPDHRRLVAFRDYLRANPDATQQYCALKRELAAAYGADREGYTHAKTAFIRAIEARCVDL